jgi:hypothetical protein
MSRRLRSLFCCTALAALAWLGPAAAVRAEWLGFRNDLPFPIVVQSLRPDLRQPKLSTPMLLYPGEVRWDWVNDTRNRIIIIHEARPPRTPLGRTEIEPPAGGDELYAVQSNGQSVRLIKQPKVKK